jgi:hypothetical protein
MVMRSFAFAQDDKKARKEILTLPFTSFRASGMLRDRKDGQGNVTHEWETTEPGVE